jgi:hypothetical protein
VKAEADPAARECRDRAIRAAMWDGVSIEVIGIATGLSPRDIIDTRG